MTLLFRFLRIRGDVRAVSRGPNAVARRLVRRSLIRRIVKVV
jgi:hypothetical protein